LQMRRNNARCSEFAVAQLGVLVKIAPPVYALRQYLFYGGFHFLQQGVGLRGGAQGQQQCNKQYYFHK
jgi:hypothetical protein